MRRIGWMGRVDLINSTSSVLTGDSGGKSVKARSMNTLNSMNGDPSGLHVNEIEFELSSEQHELLGPVALEQGHPLELTFETSILLPDTQAENWFAVQPERVNPQFVRISPGTYAFAGQIQEAEIVKAEDGEMAFLLVSCGNVPLRVVCGPGEDGRLPWGTWETRYITGISRIHGLLEDTFATGIGVTIGATVWSITRLVLTPGDAHFGEWYESESLTPSPYSHDKIFITSRLHRQGI